MSADPRPRGRPRKFDPDTVLASATERFRTGGFDGTSLDDLADATGLNRPSLYAAFGDKRALYLASLARTTRRLEAALDQLAAANFPRRRMLKALFRAAIDGFLTGEEGPSGCIAISTAATSAVEDDAVRAALTAFLAVEDDRIADMLAAGGDPDAQAHGRIAAAIVHSLSVRARAGTPREELDRLAAECIDLIAPADLHEKSTPGSN